METASLTTTELVLFTILLVWSFVWKGLALWRAAGNKDKAWYIVLLVLNTAGILEILYLFIFSKRPKKYSVES